jgi:hypothetical protein
MTIEIQKPELEALILERMQKGQFASVEDALMQALQSSPLPPAPVAAPAHRECYSTGADLVAAMQMSPYKEIVLQPTRVLMPVRDVAF